MREGGGSRVLGAFGWGSPGKRLSSCIWRLCKRLVRFLRFLYIRKVEPKSTGDCAEGLCIIDTQNEFFFLLLLL